MYDLDSYHRFRGTHFNARRDQKNHNKCVIYEYVEDNYCARFDTHSFTASEKGTLMLDLT